MRNIFENIAVTLVVLLTLLVIVLIVQYNMIEEDAYEETLVVQNVPKGEKTASYLDALEGYGEDEDVKVDPKLDNNENRVIVNSESNDNRMKNALEDSYVKELESFTQTTKKVETVTEVLEDVAEPTAPKNVERADEVGSALDDLLGDM